MRVNLPAIKKSKCYLVQKMPHKFGTFQNHFLDWLCIDNAYKNLRIELKMERQQLAKVLQISSNTIRRYEKENKAPHWYYILLRCLCGDLSLHGYAWIDCTINGDYLRSDYSTKPLNIMALNSMYNRDVLNAKQDAQQAWESYKRLEKRLGELSAVNAELLARIAILEQRLERKKAHERALKSGNVVSLFKSS